MSTELTSPNKPRTHINWGGVVKGVALVGAVVLAGVAGAYAVGLATSAAGTALATGGTLEAIAATTIKGGATIALWIGGAATELAAAVQSAWAGIPSFFGLTSTMATPAVAEAASTLSTGAMLAGGGAATAIAAHAIAPKLHAITYTTADIPSVDNTDAGILSQVKTSAAMQHSDISHATAELSSHAATHGNKTVPLSDAPQRGWRDMLSSQPSASTQQNGSWASKLNTSASTIPAPRDPNFAKQLDADRANLAAALSDSGRA